MHSTEPPPTWKQWVWRSNWLPFVLPVVSVSIIWLVVSLIPWPAPRIADDLSAADRARAEKAVVRAQAFVEALGFEPGAAVCRASSSGSAWCTARVAGSDKTFALFCSWRHPTCIENRSHVGP